MDIYQVVTDKIIAAIEAGADKWKMPWHSRANADDPMPFNVVSRKHYRGTNTLLLWAQAQGMGYDSNAWGTYQQWQAKGAQVRKGEKSTMIVFWKFFDVKSGAADGSSDGEDDEASQRKAMARGYNVFNAAQVDGYEAPAAIVLPEVERDADAEAFFANLGGDLRHGGGRAFYSPSLDFVQMPHAGAFTDMGAYYSTLAHEFGHWTGAEKRLDRKLEGRFGSESYAAEELVAELTAAFVCALLGRSAEPREDHAQYLQNWLTVLRNDKRAIFTAASAAQKAADFLVSLQPVSQELLAAD